MKRLSFIFPAIVVLAITMACKSGKDVVSHTAASAEATAVADSSFEKKSRQDYRSRLYAIAESLWMTLRADSVTCSDGSVIHNPSLEMTASRPAVSNEQTGSSMEAERFEGSDSLAVATETSSDMKEREDKVVVAEPPDKSTFWIAVALCMAVFAGLCLLRRIHRK